MLISPHWLTGNDVTADDLPTQSGERLGHDCDDAAAGGLHVGGPTAGGRYSGAEAGANSGSCVGGLGGCIEHIVLLFIN